MTFKPYEIDFMRATALGRLATIQPNGTPQVSPVGFSYNDELGTIDIAGLPHVVEPEVPQHRAQ